MSDKQWTHRTNLINSLRALANFLQEHPAVPVAPYQLDIQVSALGDDEVQEGIVEDAAAAMGVTPVRKSDGAYRAQVKFPPIRYYVLAHTKAHMDAYHEQQRLGKEEYARRHAKPEPQDAEIEPFMRARADVVDDRPRPVCSRPDAGSFSVLDLGADEDALVTCPECREVLGLPERTEVSA